jgi:BirA family transcriptional regulator, biotin operon repressor / biotin---[acetyl-CoA-carboxylase] ligase
VTSLEAPSSDLDPARVAALFESGGASVGRPLTVVALTESTNDDAKRAAREGAPSGALFVADAQTRGRGRLGRVWHSPAGENLYASFVLRPALPLGVVPAVTLAAGLAVVDAIEPALPRVSLGLKWPNDVLAGGRKIAGILCESQITDGVLGWLVVGVGINVKTREFPGELSDVATSIALSGGLDLDRGALLCRLAVAMAIRMEAIAARGLAEIAREVGARDALRGQHISIDGVAGIALGIASDGSLRVRRADGSEHQYAAGEVTIGWDRRS